MGDELLIEISKRLSAQCRCTDTVARLGGDEFVILADHLGSAEDSMQFAQKIIEVLASPVDLAENEVHVDTSVGIAVHPDDGEDLDQLLKNADMALYRAKCTGRGRAQLFDNRLAVEIQTRKLLETEIRRTIKEGGFELHYQPQIDSACNEVTGVEALLRWPHPELGSVPPDQFIPIAESTGLITSLGEWVLEEACAQINKWREQEVSPFRVAVNLSGAQFRHGNLVQTVHQITRRHGVAPRWLELELTESMLMGHVDSAAETLKGLHELGTTIAIDDFGTGYCSLLYLRRFSVDRLKIDRSFVHDMGEDPDDRAIVNAIVALAHSLNLGVIAEGVETSEQLRLLEGMGCCHAQGYLISRPLPPTELVQWLSLRTGSSETAYSPVPEADSLVIANTTSR